MLGNVLSIVRKKTVDTDRCKAMLLTKGDRTWLSARCYHITSMPNLIRQTRTCARRRVYVHSIEGTGVRWTGGGRLR